MDNIDSKAINEQQVPISYIDLNVVGNYRGNLEQIYWEDALFPFAIWMTYLIVIACLLIFDFLFIHFFNVQPALFSISSALSTPYLVDFFVKKQKTSLDKKKYLSNLYKNTDSDIDYFLSNLSSKITTIPSEQLILLDKILIDAGNADIDVSNENFFKMNVVQTIYKNTFLTDDIKFIFEYKAKFYKMMNEISDVIDRFEKQVSPEHYAEYLKFERVTKMFWSNNYFKGILSGDNNLYSHLNASVATNSTMIMILRIITQKRLLEKYLPQLNDFYKEMNKQAQLFHYSSINHKTKELAKTKKLSVVEIENRFLSSNLIEN